MEEVENPAPARPAAAAEAVLPSQAIEHFEKARDAQRRASGRLTERRFRSLDVSSCL